MDKSFILLSKAFSLWILTLFSACCVVESGFALIAGKGCGFDGDVHLLSERCDQVPLLWGPDIRFVFIVTFIRMVYV